LDVNAGATTQRPRIYVRLFRDGDYYIWIGKERQASQAYGDTIVAKEAAEKSRGRKP
jgi:hypothetical protein